MNESESEPEIEMITTVPTSQCVSPATMHNDSCFLLDLRDKESKITDIANSMERAVVMRKVQGGTGIQWSVDAGKSQTIFFKQALVSHLPKSHGLFFAMERNNHAVDRIMVVTFLDSEQAERIFHTLNGLGEMGDPTFVVFSEDHMKVRFGGTLITIDFECLADRFEMKESLPIYSC